MTWQCLLVHPCDLLFGITPEYSMAQAEKCSAKKELPSIEEDAVNLCHFPRYLTWFFLYASSLMPFHF